ncbi:Gfo/Idh/MocA family protein [Pseudogemmobacter sp. W21_MBD1_M6]|uniref:Gfo/Idh/MocA family protein n=1 Tax=Pseudogemmobacter sp. W21_MBD1_M6 TaxID=3240271 RepID=UPI003F969857
MTRIDLAIVGVGKIARDQHLPSIAGNPSFRLVAAVSRNAGVENVANYDTLAEFLTAGADVPALSLCVPPAVRFQMAWDALRAGKHVLLEKPPGATLSEVETLSALAAERGLTIYATWHSRHATGVEPARDWIASRQIKQLRIVWKEDVRRWHPGQAWIWTAGNVGVFDPGINALSILTRIMPHGIHIASADLEFPENCETPIAARLQFADPMGGDISAEFDWRHEGRQTWDITVVTDDGTLVLSDGGAKMAVDGATVVQGENREYDAIYARFADLLATGKSDVDIAPLRHVADAFMIGRRHITKPFYE